MQSDTQWAEDMLKLARNQVSAAWVEGRNELGPKPIAVMVGDMGCARVRTSAEDMGIAEHIKAARALFVRPMPCEAWSSFLEAFAPAAIPRVMDRVEQNEILVIVIDRTSRIALRFLDLQAMTVNARGGEA